MNHVAFGARRRVRCLLAYWQGGVRVGVIPVIIEVIVCVHLAGQIWPCDCQIR